MDRITECKNLLTRIQAIRKNYEAEINPLLEQLEELSSSSSVDLTSHPNRVPGMTPSLLAARLTDEQKLVRSQFSQLDNIRIEIEYSSDVHLAGIGFAIYSVDGSRVGVFNSYMASQPPHRISKSGRYSFILPARQIAPGRYYLTLTLGTHQGVLHDKVETCLWFTINAADLYATGYIPQTGEGLMQLTGTCEIIDETQKAL